MTWKEEIEIGMKLIKDGCSQTYYCIDTCPFRDFCTAIVAEFGDSPEEWKIEGEEEDE